MSNKRQQEALILWVASSLCSSTLNPKPHCNLQTGCLQEEEPEGPENDEEAQRSNGKPKARTLAVTGVLPSFFGGVVLVEMDGLQWFRCGFMPSIYQGNPCILWQKHAHLTCHLTGPAKSVGGRLLFAGPGQRFFGMQKGPSFLCRCFFAFRGMM